MGLLQYAVMKFDLGVAMLPTLGTLRASGKRIYTAKDADGVSITGEKPHARSSRTDYAAG